MDCAASTFLAVLLVAYALYYIGAEDEDYVAVYQAPILESKRLFDEFAIATKGEDLVEPFQINYAAAPQVGVAGYVPGYDSMNLSKGWTPDSDLEMAARYGDLNVIGALSTGTFTKSMNV